MASAVGGMCLCGEDLLVNEYVKISPVCRPMAMCFPLGDHATKRLVLEDYTHSNYTQFLT